MRAPICTTLCRQSSTIITLLAPGRLNGIRSLSFSRTKTARYWAAWLHVKTLAVATPARGHGFGKELMKRAELYAVERGCTDAFLDTFSFQARPFYEKLGYRVFGTLENHPAGHQHYFMTKRL